MNQKTREILNKIKSPTVEIFEKVSLVDKNKNIIPNDITVVVAVLKADVEYITSPVRNVFDKIVDNILSQTNSTIQRIG